MRSMKRMLEVSVSCALVLGMSGVAAANTIESSTMCFQGSLTQVDLGGGVYAYTGTIAMTAGKYYVTGGGGAGISTKGGFDVYAEEGGTAYVQGTGSYTIGSDHDAYSSSGPWGTWYDPDCADWDKYELELTQTHWYLRYAPTDESPMSGTLDWAYGIARETDLGTQDGGHDGSAAHGGGAGAWDWDCGWGVEVIPLQVDSFIVGLNPLGGDDYEVTLTPTPEPATMLLLGGALAGGLGVWRRKRQAA